MDTMTAEKVAKPNVLIVNGASNVNSLGPGFDTGLNNDGELKGFLGTFSSVFVKFLS